MILFTPEANSLTYWVETSNHIPKLYNCDQTIKIKLSSIDLFSDSAPIAALDQLKKMTKCSYVITTSGQDLLISRDSGVTTSYATTAMFWDPNGQTMVLHDPYFTKSFKQKVVIFLHEMFHFLGIDHESSSLSCNTDNTICQERYPSGLSSNSIMYSTYFDQQMSSSDPIITDEDSMPWVVLNDVTMIKKGFFIQGDVIGIYGLPMNGSVIRACQTLEKYDVNTMVNNLTLGTSEFISTYYLNSGSYGLAGMTFVIYNYVTESARTMIFGKTANLSPYDHIYASTSNEGFLTSLYVA